MATRWARRQPAIIHRGIAMAVNSLTNRTLRPRRGNVSVIVADIVVDRGSIFARERIIDVFMPWRRTADGCSTFVYALFVTVRRTPHRTLLLLLQEEVEETGKEEDNSFLGTVLRTHDGS